jgi:hypothetical protein
MREPEESPETKLAVAALNLWFVGQCISVFLRPTQSAGLGEWMTSVAALAMVFAGIMRCLSSWPKLPYAAQQLVIIGTALLVPMTLLGVIKGLDDPLYTALQALPWYAAVFLPALGAPRLPRVFLTVFRWHAFIGVTLAAYVLYTNWAVISSDSIRRDETLPIKVVQFVLYSLFFQMFRMPSERWFHRLVALAGLAELLIIAFASGTRQPIFLLALVVALAVWVTLRSAQGIAVSHAGGKLGAIIVAVCVLSGVVYYIYGNLLGAVNLLEKRMTAQNVGTSLRDNSRAEEVRQLVDQFGPVDYVFGRGIRGEFDNTAAPNQDNVHIGWFRTLLKGGVPLVLFFLLGYVLYGVRRLLASRDGLVLACAAIVTFFGFKSATGNIILANGHFYIVALCLGSLLAAPDSLGRAPGHR